MGQFYIVIVTRKVVNFRSIYKKIRTLKKKRTKKQTMVSISRECISVKNLREKYNDKEMTLEKWLKDPTHIYIGRNMVYVKGATKSKWSNSFTVKKYGRDECLRRYKNVYRH